MKIVNDILDSSVVDALKNNQLAVLKSDTIYGIFAKALNLDAYKNLIKTRPKTEGKYYIVLISNIKQISSLGIDYQQLAIAKKFWPGPITFVLSSSNQQFSYLANKDCEIGLRIPANKKLRDLLKATGPLLAPSCNPESKPPATNIKQAIEYFKDGVSVYVDSGEVPLNQPASTVIGFNSGKLHLLREGAVKFSKIQEKLRALPAANTPYKKRKLYKFEQFKKLLNCFEAIQFKFNDAIKNFSEINLEIGSGTADLSFGMAKKYPNQLFIATDVKADRLVQGAIKADEEGISNIIFLRININSLLSLITEKSLSTIWITFPDPMPKDRQEKHRLVNQHFLRIYKKLLKAGGYILFKTDDKPLFNYALESINKLNGKIDAHSFNLHASNLPDEYKITTVYERKFINFNKPINFVKFRL